MPQIFIEDTQTSEEVTTAINQNFNELIGRGFQRDCIIGFGEKDGWRYHIWSSGIAELWTVLKIEHTPLINTATPWNLKWSTENNPNYTCEYNWFLMQVPFNSKKYPFSFKEIPIELSTIHLTQWITQQGIFRETQYLTMQYTNNSLGINTLDRSAIYRPIISLSNLTSSSFGDFNGYLDLYVKGKVDLEALNINKGLDLNLIEEMPSNLFIKKTNENFDKIFNLNSSYETNNNIYITDMGIKEYNGIDWYVREWNDGFCELWLHKTDIRMTSENSKLMGGEKNKECPYHQIKVITSSGAQKDFVDQYDYPYKFFNRPIEIASLKWNGEYIGTYQLNGTNSTTQSGRYSVRCPSSRASIHSTTANGYLSLYIAGKFQTKNNFKNKR